MEQASLQLMRSLQNRGHELSLLSLHSLGDLQPHLQDSRIQALGLDYGRVPLWRFLFRLRRELKRQDPDALLLTGHSFPVLLGIIGYSRRQRLLAIHFHHTGVKPSWFWRLYYTLAIRMVNVVTFPSDFVRNEAISLYPTLAGMARTLRNPMENIPLTTPLERLEARDRFEFPPDSLVIGNAGWLIPRKRFDVFLYTAAEILRNRPNVHFAIAGDGPERGALEDLAIKLGITHAVTWLGWVSDTRMFYSGLDLFLFNSDWDAMGLSALEAVVQGVPVVASVLHGGLSEVLRPNIDAFLFDSHDINQLSQACQRVLDNSDESLAMVTRARDRVLSLCDPAALAEQHERFLIGA